jgi:hypothetical protein
MGSIRDMVLDTVPPFLSVVLGAGVTNWINVHQRHRMAVEDLHARAVAAIAGAEARVDYMSSVAPWRPDPSEEEHIGVLEDLGRDAGVNHARKLAEAREAVAEVLPYRPELNRFFRVPPADFLQNSRDVIAELRRGRPESG